MTGMKLGPQGPNPDSDDDDDSPATMSLMSGVAKPDNADPGVLGLDTGEGEGATGSKLPQSTLLIVAIVVVAGGALGFMRMSQSNVGEDRIDAEVRAKIDQAVAKFSNRDAMSPDDPINPANIDELFADTESVVAMFATDYTQNQVPVEYVKKNPFVLNRPKSTDNQPTSTHNRDLERQYQQWLTERRREIQKLNLEAVMGGTTPVAIVDGESVRVGQQLGNFEVVAIEGQTMRLQTVFTPTGKRVVVKLKMPG